MEQFRQKYKKILKPFPFLRKIYYNSYILQPSPNSIANYHNPKRVKLLARLRLGLSHLRDHKFNHSFQDSLCPICNCGTDVETTTQYLVHCPLFSDERLILINNVRNIDSNILNLNYSRFAEVLLFDNSSFNNARDIYFKYNNRIFCLI